MDITRTALEKYPEEGFVKAFEATNERLRTMPEVAFLRKLRNYLLHDSSAEFNFSAEMSPTTSSGRISLDEGSLLRWSGWAGADKTYLAGQRPGVRLSVIIPPYQDAMNEAYTKLISDSMEHHKSDLESYNAIAKERNLALTLGIHDGSRWTEFMQHGQSNLDAERDGKPQTDFPW